MTCNKNILLGLLLALFAFTVSYRHCQAGMVRLTFDDGLASVYKYAYPILKKNNQTATIGITYAFFISGSKDYMDRKQLLELQEQGWEVASHGLTHNPATDIPMLNSEEKITGWRVWDKKQNIYRTRYEYKRIMVLFDNGKLMKAVSPSNEVEPAPGSYYFDRPNKYLYVKPFAAGKGSKLNIYTLSCEGEMEDSKKELEKIGCKINAYITPYNKFSEKLRDLSKKYYSHVVSGYNKANFKAGFDCHHIWRFAVHTEDEVEQFKKIIKREVIENDGWVILGLHGIGDNTGWDPWDADKLQELSDWLKKKEIKVVTISEGADLYENGKKSLRDSAIK